MKTIQLRANRYDGEETVPALSCEEAEFFSVYKGEPGAFVWQADFSDPDVAYQHASKRQVESKGAYRLDTTQFDAVMHPKPVPKFPEGFTEWRGGFCPVELSQRVVAIRRDGNDTGPWAAHSLSWSHTPLVPKASDIVAYKVVGEAKPAKPTGHPHAELMAQYAEDAKAHNEPWKLWEYCGMRNVWKPMNDHPLWVTESSYRRKPVLKVCECCGQEIKG